MMPLHKYKQGEIMIPAARQATAQYLIRMGHDVNTRNWQYNWSVIHFDPSSGKPRSWAGDRPG
jgi:hypothetical protein